MSQACLGGNKFALTARDCGSRGHPLNNSHRSLWAWWFNRNADRFACKPVRKRAEKSNSVARYSISENPHLNLFCRQITSSPALRPWSTSLIQAHGTYELLGGSIRSVSQSLFFVFYPPPPSTSKYLSYMLTTPTAGRRIQTTELGTLGPDYSNKAAASVSLEQSNFAINCLPWLSRSWTPNPSALRRSNAASVTSTKKPLTINHGAVLQRKALMIKLNT